MCRLTYSGKSIADELNRVARWFSSGGTYYNLVGKVCSILGPIVKPSSAATRRHMKGSVNPKTSAKFMVNERRKIEATQPHNLLHNSTAQRNNINGISLLSGRERVSSYRVEELKARLLWQSSLKRGPPEDSTDLPVNGSRKYEEYGVLQPKS